MTGSGVFDLDSVFQAVDPFGGATGVTLHGHGASVCQGYSCVQFQLTCNLPSTSQVPCDPSVAVFVNLVNGQVHRAGKGALARQTSIASGQASILPGGARSHQPVHPRDRPSRPGR